MRWPLLLIAIVLISGCISQQPQQTQAGKTCEQAIAELPQIIAAAQHDESAKVTRVIDGDTVELEDSTRVRLVGINTPEKNEHNYLLAKLNMESLVLNKQVFLEKDISETDKYGRKLRYIFTTDKFVNAEQVSAGLASSFRYPPDTKHQFLFDCLEERAKTFGFGIWQGFGTYNLTFQINQNPDGVSDPNLESIVLTNSGAKINMNGWQLKDEATHIYTFGDVGLNEGESITLHSGSGTNSESELYWNQKTTVWNNDGDTAFLRDADGNLAATYSY